MAKQRQYSEKRDKVLMQLCKREAKKRGLDPDEPSFKAYCTKLYNQTFAGKGLSSLASDVNTEETAERLRRIFNVLDFPYAPVIDGEFIDYVPFGGNLERDVITEEEVESLFYKKYGRVVNFEKMASQFWSRDPAVKEFVEKLLSRWQSTRIPDEEDSVPVKALTSIGKTSTLGGLRYSVWDDSAYKYLFNRYPILQQARVGVLKGIDGASLIKEFGNPTYEWFKYKDEKTYISWYIFIDELGLIEIYDRGSVKSSDTGNPRKDEIANYKSVLANTTWSVAFVDETLNLDEKQCDHFYHFFGDSFFKGGFKMDDNYCQSTPAPTAKAPEPKAPEPRTTNKPLYRISEYDGNSWSIYKESENLDDFDRDERGWFKMIQSGKTGYVEDGNKMYTIVGEFKRGRGRPPGAKNKPKDDSPKAPKRGRGRPPGSKNKPKDGEPKPEPTPRSPEPTPKQPEPQSKPQKSQFMIEFGSDILDRLRSDKYAVNEVISWLEKYPAGEAPITDEELELIAQSMLA